MIRMLLFAITMAAAWPGLAQDSVAPDPQGRPPTDWSGDWVSDRGLIHLEDSDHGLTGTLDGETDLVGSVDDGQLTLSYKINRATVTATLTPDGSGRWFSGQSKSRGRNQDWIGCRDQSAAAPGESSADFSGHWLMSWGIARLDQDGDKIEGKYGANGFGSFRGKVTGHRMQADWKRLNGRGKLWIEQSPDGRRILGRTIQTKKPSVIVGLRAGDFQHHVDPLAGETVRGYADNGMLYHLRMPDSWKPGDKTDVVVLLHGSNFTTAGMVAVTANRWPQIGKRFAILGIQGERWVKSSTPPDLRFNYTYMNWMGRSTLRGFPYTHRESPALVMEVVDELDQHHNWGRVFIGGHSQGGYLTYILHMHFPEKLAGTFPIAGAMTIQAEPHRFDDEALIASQKATPMAILHGTKDRVVRFSTSEYSFGKLLAHGFAHVKLFRPSAGHPFDFLPLGEVIDWLDHVTSDDASALAEWAETQAAAGNWRDVGSAIARAHAIDATAALASAIESYEAAAAEDADDHLAAILANEDGSWVDKYLPWQDQFSLAEAAKPAAEAFEKLRKQHQPKADELESAAIKAFRSRDSDTGWQKYREIVQQHYAASQYRTLKDRVAKKFDSSAK